MPRKSQDLTKRELDSLRKRAKQDHKFRAMRSDGKQAGLCVRVRGGRVEFWFRVRRQDALPSHQQRTTPHLASRRPTAGAWLRPPLPPPHLRQPRRPCPQRPLRRLGGPPPRPRLPEALRHRALHPPEPRGPAAGRRCDRAQHREGTGSRGQGEGCPFQTDRRRLTGLRRRPEPVN